MMDEKCQFKEGDILISTTKSDEFSKHIHYVVKIKNNEQIIKPVIDNIVIDNDRLEFPLKSVDNFVKVGRDKNIPIKPGARV